MKIGKNLLMLGFSVFLSALLLYFVFSRYPLGDVFQSLQGVTVGPALAYGLVSICIMAVFTLRWKILLEAQGFRPIPFFDLFNYRVIDYGVSYLTPTAKLGGEPVRAAMLMRNGIGFKEGLTSITIDKTIELSFTVLMFVVGVFLLILSKALSGGLAVFLAMLCAFLVFINWMFYYRIWRGKTVFVPVLKYLYIHKIQRFSKFLHAVEEFERPIIKFYTEQKKAYFIALGLSVLNFALSMVEYSMILMMVGIKPTLWLTFMVFSVAGMSFLIPVPMGLGSLETFQAWLFAALSLGSAAGVGLAMVTRLRDLVWVVMAVAGALYYGSLKRVFEEAFNAHFANPVVKMTIFRGGKQDYIDIKMFRDKPRKKSGIEYTTIGALRRKFWKK